MGALRAASPWQQSTRRAVLTQLLFVVDYDVVVRDTLCVVPYLVQRVCLAVPRLVVQFDSVSQTAKSAPDCALRLDEHVVRWKRWCFAGLRDCQLCDAASAVSL